MDLDIRAIATKLIQDLEAESVLQKMKAEGVRLFYERLAEAARAAQSEEQNNIPTRSSETKEPGIATAVPVPRGEAQ